VRLSISVRQGIYVLFASLLCGLLSSIAQIYLDLQQDRIQQTKNIVRSIDLHQETLTNAAYILDKQLADKILRSLIRQPLIKSASLIDDFSDVLSAKSRQDTYPMTRYLNFASQLIDIPVQQSYRINVSPNNTRFANLTIVIDQSVLANDLIRRLQVSLEISLFFTTILTSILLILSYVYISKPVIRIAHWVNNLKKASIDPSLPYTKKDELGDLVTRFYKEWREHQSTSLQLTNMLVSLKKSERFSRVLMENSSDAMFLCYPGAKIHLVNNLAEKLTGQNSSYLIGKSLASFSQVYSDGEMEAIFDNVIAQEVWGYEDTFIATNTEKKCHVHLECRVAAILIDGDAYIMVNARDVTEKMLAQRKIHELAYFDSLTQLANRSLFSEQIENKIQWHKDNQKYGALLYFDLDQFKKINDSLGHSVGDRVLVEVAVRIRELFPTNTLCGRIGGDEFVVGLCELADNVDYAAEKALQMSNKLLTSLSEPLLTGDMTLHTTASIGIAFFPDNDIDAFELLRRADTAMYKAKSLGRNGVQFFKREMQYAAQNLLELEAGIHQALNLNQFEIWLQPQINNGNNTLSGEILVRWNHPQRGLLMPGGFIPHAEESGLIIDIDKWVLRESFVQLSTWRKNNLLEKFGKLAINVSPTFFLQVDFVSYIKNLLKLHNLPGELIILEITENLLLNNFELARNKMHQLKNCGLSFSIDDFGTGYSSLKYLKELPLDELKIDQSFIAGLTDGSDTSSIVEVIVTMAKNLQMNVIAEGVETEEQHTILSELGCKQFQGYFLSSPQPIHKFKPDTHLLLHDCSLTT